MSVAQFLYALHGRLLIMPDSTGSTSRSRLKRLLPDSERVRNRLHNVLPRLKARARLLRQRFRSSTEEELAGRLEAIDRDYVEEGARRVTDEDLETVVEQADAIEERFRDKGPLRRLLNDGRLLLGLVRDVRRGDYKAVPVWTLSAAAFALLYVLNPLDIVPDALPGLGLIDDAAVVSACIALIEQDLYDYREWLRGQLKGEAASAERPSSRPEELTSR